MQETIYVGLDLGSSWCQQTVMSGDGVRRFSRSFATSEQHLRLAFEKLGGDVRVHIEAGEHIYRKSSSVRLTCFVRCRCKPFFNG